MIKIISDFPLKGSISQEDKKVNNQPKKELEKLQKETSTINKRSSYEDWISRNWIINKKNKTLRLIKDKGIDIWRYGEFLYSITDKEREEHKEPKAEKLKLANITLSQILGKPVKLSDNEKFGFTEMVYIRDEYFKPQIKQEFFKSGVFWYRNLFEPTKYMKLVDKPHKEPKYILKLISNVVNNDKERLDYFINWLAYYWQTFKRPQIAIALQGTQGAGKGILVEDILRPLYGAKQVSILDNKVLKNDFQASMLENKLFYNLDEISTGEAKNNKEIKNFLKAFITNKRVYAQRKGIDGKEINLYGAVLITTNEPKFLDIEPKDRRYTIFSTGKDLIGLKEPFFGLDTYENLKNEIDKELEDFARYLYNYEVDTKLANTALKTKEKLHLINITNDIYTLLVNALINQDINFFQDLEDDNKSLYDDIIKGLKNNEPYIKSTNITEYLRIILENEKLSSKRIMDKLRTINTKIFEKPTQRKILGKPHKVYYLKPKKD